MLFHTALFAAFFALLLATYNLLPSWAWRKRLLIAASYLFYSAWNPIYVTVIAASTVMDWFAGRFIHGARSSASRRLWLLTTLGFNIGLLALFKYADFLAAQARMALGAVGIAFQPVDLGLAIPVGISFYTFQTLSYSLDIYYRRLEPAESFADYALYVSFFPQLVAGPIVRARQFLPQLASPKATTGRGLSLGLKLLIVGVFQKVVLADALLAPMVVPVYDGSAAPGPLAAWLGTLAFSGQIFFDFSGYSTCAVGAAVCLGFRLPRNFRQPYGSVGLRDFWRRWHITLSRWLRDYLYVPLGGSRAGAARTGLALMFTMLLGGLWHGAAWHFVLWGGLHGLLLTVEHGLRRSGLPARVCPSPGARRASGVIVTFLLVTLAWVLFRAPDLQHAVDILRVMLTPWGAGGRFPYEGTASEWLGGALAISLVLWHAGRHRLAGPLARVSGPGLAGAGYGVLLALIIFSGGDSEPFIYFQF